MNLIKKILFFGALLFLSLKAEGQTTGFPETLFNGYGVIGRTDHFGDVTDVTISSFVGGRKDETSTYYTVADLQQTLTVGASLFSKCHRFEVLSVNSLNPFSINVSDPTNELSKSMHIKSRCAISENIQTSTGKVYFAMPNNSDGNNGLFVGIPPDDYTCMLNNFIFMAKGILNGGLIRYYSNSGPPVDINGIVNGNDVDYKFAINTSGECFIWNSDAAEWQPCEKDPSTTNENQRLGINGTRVFLYGNGVTDTINIANLVTPQFRGSYDVTANSNIVPRNGVNGVTGSGPGGQIRRGDHWVVSVGGTISGLTPNAILVPGNMLYAVNDITTNFTATSNWTSVASNMPQTGKGIATVSNKLQSDTDNGNWVFTNKDSSADNKIRYHIGGPSQALATPLNISRWATSKGFTLNFDRGETVVANPRPFTFWVPSTAASRVSNGILFNAGTGLYQQQGGVYKEIFNSKNKLIVENFFGVTLRTRHNNGTFISNQGNGILMDLDTAVTYTIFDNLTGGSTNFVFSRKNVTFEQYNSSRPSDGAPLFINGFDNNGKITKHTQTEVKNWLGITGGGTYTASEGVSMNGTNMRLGSDQDTSTTGALTGSRFMNTKTHTLHFNRYYSSNSTEPITLWSKGTNSAGIRYNYSNNSNITTATTLLRQHSRGFNISADSTITIQSGRSKSVTKDSSIILTAKKSTNDSANYAFNNGFARFSNYKNTRNDTGIPMNFFASDANGTLQSHPITELGINNLAGEGLKQYANNKIHLGGNVNNKAIIDSTRYINYPNRYGTLTLFNDNYITNPFGSSYFTPLTIDGLDKQDDAYPFHYGSRILFVNRLMANGIPTESFLSSDYEGIGLTGAYKIKTDASSGYTRTETGTIYNNNLGYDYGHSIELYDPNNNTLKSYLKYILKTPITNNSKSQFSISDYANRNDAGKPRNIVSVNNNDGTFEVHNITELNDSLVTSFNGRRGNVLPVAGDYSATQISATPIAASGSQVAVTGTNVQAQIGSIATTLKNISGGYSSQSLNYWQAGGVPNSVAAYNFSYSDLGDYIRANLVINFSNYSGNTFVYELQPANGNSLLIDSWGDGTIWINANKVYNGKVLIYPTTGSNTISLELPSGLGVSGFANLYATFIYRKN